MSYKDFTADVFHRLTTPVHTSYGTCRHWREPVRVGQHVVTCSSETASHGHELRTPPVPDFGIYLSKAWQDRLGKWWTNGSFIKVVARPRPYPALVYDWPDMQAPSAMDLDVLVDITMRKMRQGRSVDIGCSFAHGRTGSLLACLLVRYERLSGPDAIREVRSRYCKHAIESGAQESAVKVYAEERGRGR